MAYGMSILPSERDVPCLLWSRLGGLDERVESLIRTHVERWKVEVMLDTLQWRYAFVKKVIFVAEKQTSLDDPFLRHFTDV